MTYIVFRMMAVAFAITKKRPRCISLSELTDNPILFASSEVGAAGNVVAGNQVLDEVEQADWPPRAPAAVSLRRRPSTLIADGDYDDLVDKRYMRFGRRSSDEKPDDAAADKRYMRFGRVGAHLHPLMGFAKRYMRFGRR